MVQTDSVKEFAHSLGFSLVGVCCADPPSHLDLYRQWLNKGYHGEMDYLRDQLPLRSAPQNLLPQASSIIAVGLNYYQNPIHLDGHPRIARYAWGRDYHKVVRSKLKKLVKWLESEERDAHFRVCVDSAPIFDREYAQQAGLGWFGKNSCLINTHQGSWFVIGLVLTTLDLEPDKPAIGQCGTCRACIEACPNGAIVFEEDRWQIDARRCISYITIEERRGGEGKWANGQIDKWERSADEEHSSSLVPSPLSLENWLFGCDICQEVCPFNRKAIETTEPDFLIRREWPSFEELAQIEYDQWDELTLGSPVRRIGYNGLRRNARRLL